MVGISCRRVTLFWKTMTKESQNQFMSMDFRHKSVPVKVLCLTLVFVPVLLLLLCHPQPHRGAEAAGHVGPAVLPYQGQVEGSDVPGRGTEVAWSVLGIPIPATRRQFALPEQPNTFPSGSTVLSRAGGHPSWRRSPEDYWKGQEVKRLYIRVGFNDL